MHIVLLWLLPSSWTVVALVGKVPTSCRYYSYRVFPP